MIKKIFALLFALTIPAQSIAALNNPFNKTSSVDVGSSVSWDIKKGVARKTSTISDGDGTFYQLKVTRSEISLQLLESASGKTKSFDQLKIEEVQIDGDDSALFQWCLANQDGHDRFLQQGLSVNKGICQNNGRQGSFVMKLNQATYEQLKKAEEITFLISPYRSAVLVSFHIKGMSDVFARLSGKTKPVVAKPVKKTVPKPVPKPVVAKPPVKPKPAKLCSIKPPANFASIKPVRYVCDNAKAKANARKKMAASVKKLRDKRARQAREKRQTEKALAKQKALEEEKRKEEEAISKIEQNMNKVRSQVSERMINMCKKKWAEGEHRCYCEPYLEFAPAGISSDKSCGGS